MAGLKYIDNQTWRYENAGDSNDLLVTTNVYKSPAIQSRSGSVFADNNDYFFNILFDVQRKVYEYIWRYENPGTADLLAISGNTVTNLPVTQSKTGIAFWQKQRVATFPIPATKELWAKFDVYYSGSNRWRAYDRLNGNDTGVGRYSNVTTLICYINGPTSYNVNPKQALTTATLHTILLHMVSDSTNGLVEAWLDGVKCYSDDFVSDGVIYKGNVENGADFENFYIQSEDKTNLFSNVIISNAPIDLDDNVRELFNQHVESIIDVQTVIVNENFIAESISYDVKRIVAISQFILYDVNTFISNIINVFVDIKRMFSEFYSFYFDVKRFIVILYDVNTFISNIINVFVDIRCKIHIPDYYISIYKGNPTAGGTDGDVVSTGHTYISPIEFNERSNEFVIIPLAIRVKAGYYARNVTIGFNHNDDSHYLLCKTIDGTYVPEISFEEVLNTNVLFFLRFDNQYSSGIPANLYYGGEISSVNTLKAYLSFNNSVTKDFCNNTWNIFGSPSITEVTINGNSFGSNSCLRLDGSSGLFLDDIVLGGSDFTIDGWILVDDSKNYNPVFSLFGNYSIPTIQLEQRLTNLSLYQSHKHNLSLLSYSYDENLQFITVRQPSPSNVNSTSGHHFAIVYQHKFGTLDLYIDGIKKVSQNRIIDRMKYRLSLGAVDVDLYCIKGCIDEFRVYDGYALYIEDFTVPSTEDYNQITDLNPQNSVPFYYNADILFKSMPFIKNGVTKVHLHFNDGIIEDTCGNTWVKYGNPLVLNNSLRLNGESYLSMSDDLILGDKSFLISCKFNLFDLSDDVCIFSLYDSLNDCNNNLFISPTVDVNDSNHKFLDIIFLTYLYSYPYYGGRQAVQSEFKINKNTEYFVELYYDNDNNVIYIYLNNILIFTQEDTALFIQKNFTTFYIGKKYDSSNSETNESLTNLFNGIIDEFKIVEYNEVKTSFVIKCKCDIRREIKKFFSFLCDVCITYVYIIDVTREVTNDSIILISLTLDVTRAVRKIGKYLKAWLPFDDSPTEDLCGNTWTTYGNPTIGTANAFSGKALQLDGSSYIKLSNVMLGGQDFYIDGWVYVDSSSPNYARVLHIVNPDTGNAMVSVRKSKDDATKLDFWANFYAAVNQDLGYTYTSSINSVGSRVHVKLIYRYSDKIISLCINDVTAAEMSTRNGNRNATQFTRRAFDIYIGALSNGNQGVIGSVDEFRIYDGTWFSYNYGVTPTAVDYFKQRLALTGSGNISLTYDLQRTVKNDAKLVEMLAAYLPFDDSPTEDLCGNTWTTYGNPTIGTSGAINGNALQLDGASYIKLNGSITLGGKDFTISGWATMNASTAQRWAGLFALNGNRLRIIRYNTLNNAFEIGYKSALAKVNLPSALTSQFYFELDYQHSTGKWFTFFNGVLAHTYTSALARTTYNNVWVGANGDNRSDEGIWGGSIDEFQIYDGVTLHTKNFTPPTADDYFDLERALGVPVPFEGTFDVMRTIVKPVIVFIDIRCYVVESVVEYIDTLVSLSNYFDIYYDLIRIINNSNFYYLEYYDIKRNLISSVQFYYDLLISLDNNIISYYDAKVYVSYNVEMYCDIIYDILNQYTCHFDIIRNIIAPIFLPDSGNIKYTLSRLRIYSEPQKFILPETSKFYIYGDLVGKINIYSDTNMNGVVNGSYYFEQNSLKVDFAESNVFYISLNTQVMSPQDVIKLFIHKLNTSNLVGELSLNRAITYVTNGKYVSWNNFIDSFLSCLNSVGYSRFLDFYCDIILDNTDTGAITGWDAGGLVVKTADSIITESIPIDRWILPEPGSSVIIDKLRVHFPETGYNGTLTNAEKYILAGLNSEWIYRSLELIWYSIGVGFSVTDPFYDVYVEFSYNSSSSTLAYVTPLYQDGVIESLILTVNMYYYANMDVTDANGKATCVETYLDRILSHEITHVIMLIKNVNYDYLPEYIIEGLSELIHGIDDMRYDNIVSLLTTRKNDLVSGLIDEEYVYDTDKYAIGYILLRFLAKQGQHIKTNSTYNRLIINNFIIANVLSSVITTVYYDVQCILQNNIHSDVNIIVNNNINVIHDVNISVYVSFIFNCDVIRNIANSSAFYMIVFVCRIVKQRQLIMIDVNRKIKENYSNYVMFNVVMYGVKNTHINSVVFNLTLYGIKNNLIHFAPTININPSKTRTKLYQCIKPVIMLLIKPVDNDMIVDHVSSLALRSTPLYPDRSNKGYNVRG